MNPNHTLMKKLLLFLNYINIPLIPKFNHSSRCCQGRKTQTNADTNLSIIFSYHSTDVAFLKNRSCLPHSVHRVSFSIFIKLHSLRKIFSMSTAI